MKKKALALAVAGALGAPALALAQASTVQLYGQVRADYQYLKQGDGLKSVDAFSGRQSVGVVPVRKHVQPDRRGQ